MTTQEIAHLAQDLMQQHLQGLTNRQERDQRLIPLLAALLLNLENA